MPRLLTTETMRQWSRCAAAGDKIAYHKEPWPRDRKAFQAARDLFEEGKVILYQERGPDGRWTYIAQRVSCRVAAWLDRMEAAHV